MLLEKKFISIGFSGRLLLPHVISKKFISIGSKEGF